MAAKDDELAGALWAASEVRAAAISLGASQSRGVGRAGGLGAEQRIAMQVLVARALGQPEPAGSLAVAERYRSAEAGDPLLPGFLRMQMTN